MGINFIEQENGESLAEYKLPDFINENSNIEDQPDDFEILSFLGQGSFSKIMKVKSKKNFEIYAMKKINATEILKQYHKDKYYMNEVLLLQKLNDPNIVKCYKIFEVLENEEKYIYFIMEYMNNGDLQSYNNGNITFNLQIPEPKLWYIYYKCLCGLHYIHNKGIIHRDIKASNILIDDNFNIKIADFNISAVVDENFAKFFAKEEKEVEDLLVHNTQLGSRGYIPPEILRKRQYDQKVDIYSMGIMFFELCYQCQPDENKKPKNDLIATKEINDFIIKMIEDDPNKRPTAEEAMLTAKKYFIKYYLKNSSLISVMNCFSNFPNFKKYFHDNEKADLILKSKKELPQKCLDIALSLDTEESIENEQIKETLYNLRKLLLREELLFKRDNEEIDPGMIINFLIKKLNTDLNEAGNIEENNEEIIKRYGLLNKNFHFSPGRENYYFKLIINNYNTKICSFISRNFFSFILTERTCLNCGTSRLYFSQSLFIPINVSILRKKKGYNKNINVKDGFDCLKGNCVQINEEKALVCKKCNLVSKFKEKKNFYRTAKNLIIFFDRGENYENGSFVDFDEKLSINNLSTEIEKQVQYQLKGIITKLNDEYFSYIKKNNSWISSKGELITFDEIKKVGVLIALFYYSENTNLTVENKEKIDLSPIILEEQIFIDKYHFTYYNKTELNTKDINNFQSNKNNRSSSEIKKNTKNTKKIDDFQSPGGTISDSQMNNLFGIFYSDINVNNEINASNNNFNNINNINTNMFSQETNNFNINNILPENNNDNNNINDNINQVSDFKLNETIEWL